MKRSGRILLLGSLLLLQSCLDWFLERPDFTLKEVAITRISPTHINFLFGIEVKNPNSFDLKLRALEYTVYFNDREVGKGRLDKEVRIAQSSSTLVQVPLRADFQSLGDPLAMIIAGHALRYKIAGEAVFKASLASATIPFSQRGEITLKR